MKIGSLNEVDSEKSVVRNNMLETFEPRNCCLVLYGIETAYRKCLNDGVCYQIHVLWLTEIVLAWRGFQVLQFLHILR